MKKNFVKIASAVTLTCAMTGAMVMPALAKPSKGDLVRFVPTEIEVDEDSEVWVKGYFLNLNEDVTVKNFKEVDLTIYYNGEKIVEGDFGTINKFSVKPLSAVYQSFTFSGVESSLSEGHYDCDESVYSKFSAKFSSEEY